MTLLLLALAADAADPEALLHEARTRARHGDYQGVRVVADQALTLPGDHQRTAQYLIAISWELGGDPARALPIYDALIDAWPRHEVPEDLTFRRAECLDRLGRHTAARRDLRRLGDPRRRGDPVDAMKIGALRGVFDITSGRSRRGHRRLDELLADAPGHVAPDYQAKAHHALLTEAVHDAQALTFTRRDGRKARDLQHRAELIQAAREHLVAEIELRAPASALDGFLKLGHAHWSLGQDLLDERPPRGLTDEQRALNRALLAEKVTIVWTKGTRFFDRGLRLATQWQWTAEPVPSLQQAHASLVLAVEALAER